MPIPSYVETCCAILRAGGHAAHPVGGCVRDLLLGVEPADWDVATSAPPEAVQALFARSFPTGLPHGTVTVRVEHQSIEVTTFRREWGYSDGRRPDGVSFDAELLEDLSRRDFTINAMALDEDGGIIDPFGGQADLRAGLVRCVGDPVRRFREDALRMFRAIRFAVRLGFTLAPETAAALDTCGHLVNRLAGERVRVEVEKTITSPNFAPFARLPDDPICRWAAFCTVLGAPPSEVLGALKTENALRHAVCAGHMAAERPPQSPADWRRLLAEHGEPAARAAAAVLQTRQGADPADSGPFAALAAVLAEHPPQGFSDLALSGGDLLAMGYAGQQIGAVQRFLLQTVVESPDKNTHAALCALLAAEFPL